MGYSKITITFNEDLALNNAIGFQVSSPAPNFILAYPAVRWVDIRTGQTQVPIGTPTATPGERSAVGFYKVFNLDFNANSSYKVTLLGNVVIIESNVPTVEFSNVFYKDVYYEPETIPQTKVTFSIDNFSGSAFALNSLVFSAATTNPVCTHYKVTVETSELATKINSPYVDASNTNNPFTFEALRGQGFVLSIESADAQKILLTKNSAQVPSLLNNSSFTLVINNSPSGATVIVNSSNLYVLALEYSLDNLNWQSENTFPGLFSGDYILYIRDDFGCTTSIDFNVNDDNIYTPVSYYSKSNSIIMVEQNGSVYKTEDNTLSNEAFAINPILAHPEYHLFKNTHVITCQLLSNYSSIVAKVIKQDGTEDTLSVNKFTYNIGRKDARDAIKFNAGFGKTGIYFTTGKLYDFDTDAYQGNDYSLLGGLPEWAVIGNYFSINNAYFKIENIYYDDDLSAEVILIDALYTGVPLNIVTKAIYNRQDYDVFEWIILMSLYNNQTIQIKTIETDARFETKTRISEKIMVKESHKDVAEVVSYNTKNTDVYYASGIKHYALVHVASKGGDHEDPSEINKGDDASSLIDSKLYESVDYVFDLLSLGGYRQLTRMLSNNIVFIDTKQFIKNGSIEKEGPIEESNLYKLKAKMLYAEGGLNSNSSEAELITGDENFDVPKLIIDEAGNYIIYQ